MKKVLAAILCLVSMSASASKVFGDWVVPSENDRMYSYSETGFFSVEVKVSDEGFSIIQYPKKSTAKYFDSESSSERSIVLLVNGKAVNFTAMVDRNGWIVYFPATKKGRIFVLMEYWNKPEVTYQIKGTAFYLKTSAKGVRSAATYLSNNQPI